MFDSPKREVFVRVAKCGEGTVYLDLGNERREIVEITTSGWRVLSGKAVPVRFVRKENAAELPRPVSDGSIGDLRRLVNVRTDEDFVLIVSWVIGALNPDGPYPILIVQGEQGSAKSTTARVLRSIIDPAVEPLRAPPRNDGQWRTTRGYLDFLAWFRSRACHYSAGGKRIDYARESRLEAYGWSAFWSWLRSFPGRCGPEKAIGEWYIAGVFPGYYVDPNFYEPMGYQDLVGYLRDQYPPRPSSYPDATMHLNLFTGHVSFGNPDHALRYADDLKRTMHELGVLCSPVVVIEGHTDRRPERPGSWQVEEEGASPNSGMPQLEEFKQQGLLFDLSDLERKKRRTADLEKRLDDPNIPGRRKARIRHMLRVEQESERGAARSLDSRSREEIYELALSLARERDRIIEEKKHIEYQLAAVREGLIR